MGAEVGAAGWSGTALPGTFSPPSLVLRGECRRLSADRRDSGQRRAIRAGKKPITSSPHGPGRAGRAALLFSKDSRALRAASLGDGFSGLLSSRGFRRPASSSARAETGDSRGCCAEPEPCLLMLASAEEPRARCSTAVTGGRGHPPARDSGSVCAMGRAAGFQISAPGTGVSFPSTLLWLVVLPTSPGERSVSCPALPRQEGGCSSCTYRDARAASRRALGPRGSSKGFPGWKGSNCRTWNP